ncbi:universal stress protein [Nocardioides mesophilus]|uniref:Universal stress protein n=1 Tax=Nocardioides mesophilus TaxID=433659 RepID=A0A7G9R8F5_9ACTN|nr:universal stress protein [Nocardioides mesophilus]QNN51880.1 universal stress protein [Nocardioides mesophilus]
MSMSTRTPQEQRAETAASRVVVGVDPDGRSTSAVSWAAREADHPGGSLTLVTAYPTLNTLSVRPEAASPARIEAQAQRDIEHLLRGLEIGRAETKIVVDAGTATQLLLDTAATADLLVIGRRALSKAHRLTATSTSVAVAGRSPVPTVVVPEHWVQLVKRTAPIVVGVEMPELPPPGRPKGDTLSVGTDEAVLEFAAARADRLGVALVVVSAWDVPSLYAWSPDDITECRTRYDEQLEALVTPWRERYPELEITVEAVAETPTDAVVDASHVAQLAVVGRHTSPRHLGGFHVGSTARAVLHHAEVPIAVVPALSRAGGRRHGHPEDVWTPTY